MNRAYDAVVLGAGLYGAKVALELKTLGLSVMLIDPNPLMSQATTVNQNRVHAGYHYPRSVETARTAAENYNRFLIDHASAIAGNTRHLYCIAEGSKVSPKQYEAVMSEVGAPMERVETPSYFTPGMIAQAYETHEKSFHIGKLRALINYQLKIVRIELLKTAAWIAEGSDAEDWVTLETPDSTIKCRYLFNCTYAALDKIVPIRTKLIKEHVEVPLFRIPSLLGGEDITIMDGPYFSIMDYPPEPGVSAVTHVQLGRHHVWPAGEEEPHWNRKSRWEDMIDDIAEYIPAMRHAHYLSSMLTTRVLLADNKDDDGRPVLIEYSSWSPRIISILGSKFNSIYPVIDFLRRGEWAQRRS
jgi:glycine/D-amino acid oxidase-like deaminating enzyme